jgi:hypothetical protein
MVCSLAAAQTQLTDNTVRLDDGQGAGAARLSDIQWLTGYWIGEGLGGIVDEMWSPARRGSMVGTFRMWKDGELAFSEYFHLAEDSGSVRLRLKHFDSDFHGWEEKDKFVEFPLVKVDGKTAWFDGLTYRLNADGTLSVFVAMKRQDGSFREVSFLLKKSE